MKKAWKIIKNPVLSIIILAFSFFLSLFFQLKLNIHGTIPVIFVFAVFLVSWLTDGYVYGITAAVVSTFAVNYAFAFPYFKLNFTIPENSVSAVIMIVVAVGTGALTTKIKRQEAMNSENEKERMRANLLRAVSHDLRTPLTTIYGSSSAILDNFDSFSDEQKKQMLKGIKEDSQWLVHMVENLLSITRIDSGNVKIIKSPTVLDELIDSVLVKFKKRYPEQDVILDIPDEIVIIPMDAMLIEQVIDNILENAVLHAAGLTELKLKVFTLSGRAIFEISDNGCGIPKERFPALFSGCFDNSSQAADGQKNNTGIGLSVCATIIKAHGGDITAENAKSGGAIFRFSLAIDEDTEEA